MSILYRYRISKIKKLLYKNLNIFALFKRSLSAIPKTKIFINSINKLLIYNIFKYFKKEQKSNNIIFLFQFIK